MGPEVPQIRKSSRRRNPRGGVHFLTFSCYHRLPLFGSSGLRNQWVKDLVRAHKRHNFKLLAWVVKPEHVHVIVVPTAAPTNDRPGVIGSAIPSILIALKKPLAESAIKRWKAMQWKGLAALADTRGRAHFWQPGGGFDRNVRTLAELQREVRYIHHNPVERGLAAASTDWPWSSARWYAGLPDAVPPIDHVTIDRISFPGPRPEIFVPSHQAVSQNVPHTSVPQAGGLPPACG